MLRLIREILDYKPKHRNTSIKAGLIAATRIMKHSGIVFVMSDFLGGDYDFEIKRLARRNDVVCLKIMDPAEAQGFSLGWILLKDAETDSWTWSKSGIQKKTALPPMDSKGIYEQLLVETDKAYLDLLVHFFKARKARKGKK